MRLRRGDTLIEVTIAVGIFSMIAVAVVSVISGSISNAQISLETTVTREQIDAQAEALRFIHNSYISSESKQDDDNKFVNIWREITKYAIISTNDNSVLDYFPKTCAELYDGNANSPVIKQNAFILDPNHMDGSENEILYRAGNGAEFKTASTYPRLVYNTDDGALLNNNTQSVFKSAEGLYIIAVKDNNSTPIVSDKDTTKNTAAYYNFYIRSCWYGPGAEHPSTISTIVRLYDPDAIAAVPLVRTTPYIVKHYTKNVWDASYTKKKTETRYITSGTNSVALDSIKHSFNGFYYTGEASLSGSVGGPGALIKGETVSIAPDGSTVIYMFYRPNVLNIQFDVNGGQLAPVHGADYSIQGGLIAHKNEINFLRGAFGTLVGQITDWNTYTVTNGLINPTNPQYINIVKEGYRLDPSGMWYCKKDGKIVALPQSGLWVVEKKVESGVEPGIANLCGVNIWKPNPKGGVVTVKLYANWINDQAITIAFNGNGANNEGAMPNQTIPSGLNGKINANAFVRNGYRFDGWCTKPVTGASECINSGASYFDNGADIDANGTLSWAGKTLTLYAIWKGQLTIVFNGNGADGGAMPNQTIDSGLSGNINANIFTRSGGYIFDGWCTKPTTTGTECINSGAGHFDNRGFIGADATQSWAGKTLTLYANWRK